MLKEMLNIENMEETINAIENSRYVHTTKTDKIADFIKQYCIDSYNNIKEEKNKLISFINSHKNIFYYFDKNAGFDIYRVRSINCRNWNKNSASVYIGNIEIVVNPQNGEAIGVTTQLDFQYHNNIGTYRNNVRNLVFDKNRKDVDFWVEMKKMVDYAREDFSYVVKEFKSVLENLLNVEKVRCDNMLKCCKEIEAEKNATSDEVTITIKIR